MQRIKNLLELDLAEDIRDVIDLEDRSEKEIQHEVENYIITNKIAEHINKFSSEYQSNIKETGVWLSGFYGSGKSYFGKMLGYILENRVINGTLFQERFIQRLSGLKNQSIIENTIRRLGIYNAKVIFLDIAKQNTSNGFAWTLFKNFLRTLGFLDDVFGYMEYGLFLEGKYNQFVDNFKKITGRDWKDIRRNPMEVPHHIRKVLSETLYTDEDYIETKKYLDQRMTSYDAAKFKDELTNYLEKHTKERIVFIIDEVSEAISQKKIDLLELEGISEALSGIANGKVWTIAISQEKLEDVIHNANLSIKELSKVTDRFKTRIHLSSEEIDTVIKKRLLIKTESANKTLKEYYDRHNGLITDATSLNAKFPTKCESFEEFAIYYPFHRYQFELLQNYLFSVHLKAKTGGTERGMIIATYIILKAIKDNKLFSFITGYHLADGGKKVIESELERKYGRANTILKDAKSSIQGEHLMKTIHFLNESEQVPATAENITRLYLEDPEKYYGLKPDIEKALNILCDKNMLLEKSGIYKITSDLEQRLIDEMKNLHVELHYKKRHLIDLLRNQSFISNIAKLSYEGNSYLFHITTVQGDELQYSTNKYIKIQVANPYTMELENHEEFIEKIKFETQGHPERATLIPEMKNFPEIDKLIGDIYRYGVIEDRYKNDDDDRVRSIIKDFAVNKNNRIKATNQLIEKSYLNGTVIYHFEEHKLNENNFFKAIQEIETKIICNTYTDRLPMQLNEETGLRILKEKTQSKLRSYFSGKEFEFFDSDGNFIGDRLRVIENIVKYLSTVAKAGHDLEEHFSKPPYGYNYGTLNVVLAVLMRAGRLAITYNGIPIYNFKDDEVQNIFGKSREFKKAEFKVISSVLSLHEKQQIVDHLRSLKTRDILNKDFNYSTNDFELVSLIGEFAQYFILKVEDRSIMIHGFDAIFPDIPEQIRQLRPFTGKVTDANHKTKAETFLEKYKDYTEAIGSIQEVINFIETKLSNIKKYELLVKNIIRELQKLDVKYQHNIAFEIYKNFKEKYEQSVIKNYVELEQLYQKIRDTYFQLMKTEHDQMAEQHKQLKIKAEQEIKQIKKIDEDLNEQIIGELKDIENYAEKRTCNNLRIEYEISCQGCHFSLNEIIISNQHLPLKLSQIEILKTKVVYAGTKIKDKTEPKKIKFKLDRGEFQVAKYKNLLNGKIQQLNSYDENDIVIVE